MDDLNGMLMQQGSLENNISYSCLITAQSLRPTAHYSQESHHTDVRNIYEPSVNS